MAEVRPLNKEELCDALALVWEVFQEFEAPEYTEEGVQSFREFIELQNMLHKFLLGEMEFTGFFERGILAGVAAVRRPAHISLLFVQKALHRHGIARRLVQTIQQQVQMRGAEILTVNSSPYAVPVYERLGFFAKDAEQIADGIRFTPMELYL